MKKAPADQFDFNDLLTARKARDVGMQQAEDRANRSSPGWSDIAFEFLVSYAKANREFISEDVSGATKKIEFPQPPTDKAWGAVYLRAVKRGVIRQAGAGRSLRRHNSICPLWGSLIFEGAQ